MWTSTVWNKDGVGFFKDVLLTELPPIDLHPSACCHIIIQVIGVLPKTKNWLKQKQKQKIRFFFLNAAKLHVVNYNINNDDNSNTNRSVLLYDNHKPINQSLTPFYFTLCAYTSL